MKYKEYEKEEIKELFSDFHHKVLFKHAALSREEFYKIALKYFMHSLFFFSESKDVASSIIDQIHKEEAFNA